MFLEQTTQNATTWSRTLDELANLIVEFEKTKKKLFATSNGLQTCSLKLEIMQQIFKNCDKELVTVKGQLIKV